MASGKIDIPFKGVKWHTTEVDNYSNGGVTNIPWNDCMICFGVLRLDNAESYALCGAMKHTPDDGYGALINMGVTNGYLSASFTAEFGWGRLVYALFSENELNT